MKTQDAKQGTNFIIRTVG